MQTHGLNLRPHGLNLRLIMPKLGLTMTHGTITEWLKQPGDAVEAEEALCTYETEKVTLELPAPEDGVLTEILVPAGTTVAAGTPVCVVTTKGEGQESVAGGTQPPASTPTSQAVQLPDSRFQPSARSPVNATPKARALARQMGVDLATVAGSGPGGRVQAANLTPYPRSPLSPLLGGEGRGGRGEWGEVKATPLARHIAASEGIDLHNIIGTGPEGTITREDVEQAVRGQEAGGRGQGAGIRGQEAGIRSQEAGDRGQPAPAMPVGPGEAEIKRLPSPVVPQPAVETIVPLTSLRRTIAERMSQSAFSAPHVTLMTEAEATNLVSARAQINEELLSSMPGAPKEAGASAPKISYNALLATLVARALREHPRLNSRLETDGIHEIAAINVALAVDTERGLMTPVLRNIERLSLVAIQQGFDELIARALAGKSFPSDFEAGTFTITNLGSLDVDGFTPIINPPQAAILGVGRIVEKPVARDGAVVVRPMITLSLSFDHRIVDGARAAKFLQRVKQLIERPMALLL